MPERGASAFEDEYGISWKWSENHQCYVPVKQGEQDHPDHSHAFGGDADLFDPASHSEQPGNPSGVGIMASWNLGDDWDTDQVQLYIDNDPKVRDESRALVRHGADPKDLAEWGQKIILAVSRAAAEWMDDPKANLNDYMVDPAKVNWQRIWQDIVDEFREDYDNSEVPDTLPPHWGSRRRANDYRMQHQVDEDNPAMSDEAGIESVMPDFYDRPELYAFGHDAQEYQQLVQVMRAARNNPDFPVTIYRGIAPVDGRIPDHGASINTGDWVTPCYQYAKQHAMHHEDETLDGPVLSATVPASMLRNEGYPQEWAYFGPPVQSERTSSAQGARVTVIGGELYGQLGTYHGSELIGGAPMAHVTLDTGHEALIPARFVQPFVHPDDDIANTDAQSHVAHFKEVPCPHCGQPEVGGQCVQCHDLASQYRKQAPVTNLEDPTFPSRVVDPSRGRVDDGSFPSILSNSHAVSHEAPSLDECPECAAQMVPQAGETHCLNCGLRQPHVELTSPEGSPRQAHGRTECPPHYSDSPPH